MDILLVLYNSKIIKVAPSALHLCSCYRTFSDTMHSLKDKYKWVTKLSSAGLVYLHFGHRIVAQFLKSEPEDDIVEIIYQKVYENFVEEIDAIDNGISVSDEPPR